ncbi:DUF2235 domain-containing protein [Marinomonas aquiplantarum]|uniref:Putative alpha/beta hydrolase family protein DUF2235 n=1 Tax=Marinomonas aquiplantarum TaxID=491951 RepID=A0A366CXY3_9GAMM|nr:DUF2235 domain-containing protein [Marinomonas aquiplantarum]RBO82673.1 putative alpha/beta hydrolase family protein DUF2235 [Marinomonas aquiplantarum]
MAKRIVICADGTWNKPEVDLKKDFPTNVLKFARSIQPVADDGTQQQVFYDWGVGSYYSSVMGGTTGLGVHKNIMDGYRYIIQNYSDGDEIFLFGFSRGAYTVRSLCGLINNCGILKRPNANRVQEAFNLYKKSGKANKPNGQNAIEFRSSYSHENRNIKFVGVWDTVGAMGIPISFLGMFEDKDEFYDSKLGSNVGAARHAMAIDEHRSDFQPTIWEPRPGADIKQTWFSGVHCDVGGSYKPDKRGLIASDDPMHWMVSEALGFGLGFEPHWTSVVDSDDLPKLNNSRRSFYRLRDKHLRPIGHGKGNVLIHKSVKRRWDSDPSYRPKNLKVYVEENGWPDSFE